METCRRVVKRMMRQQLAASWSAFVATVMTRKSNREAVDKVLRAMRHRSMVVAFNSYTAAAERARGLREVAARGMAKWRSRGLVAALEAWVEYGELTRQERAEQAQTQARQLLLDESRAQEQSAEAKVAREAERRMETCRRVVKRMMRQQLAASWTCFVDTVMTRKSNREAVGKVTCTLTAPLFVRSWSLCIASVSVHTCRECLGAYRAQLGTD
jgi:hypothetical protein